MIFFSGASIIETQSDGIKNQIIDDIKKIINNRNQVKIKAYQDKFDSDTNNILYHYDHNPELTHSYSPNEDQDQIIIKNDYDIDHYEAHLFPVKDVNDQYETNKISQSYSTNKDQFTFAGGLPTAYDKDHFKADVDSDNDNINHDKKDDEGIVNDILDKYEILLNYYDDEVINSIGDFSENSVNFEMDHFSESYKKENHVNTDMDDFSEDFKNINAVNSEKDGFSSKISGSEGVDMTSLFDTSTISDWSWQP